MSSKKKIIRAKFRNAVFVRDNYICRVCGRDDCSLDELDAHHITDRNEMPNGGYVPENGITLCPQCHVMAEFEHTNGKPWPRYSRAELYELVGSSHEEAVRASEKLDG